MADRCTQCEHDFDPHILVATSDSDPLRGGVMLCQVKGCQCYGTWGWQGDPCERIPDRVELEQMREVLQDG